MPQSADHIRWADLPVEPMNPLLGRQFVTGANVMVSRITLAAGAHVPRHAHANEQAACLLAGCLRFVLYESADGQHETAREFILRPDEVLIIPPNVPHEAFALEDTINLDIFAPPRQDWIGGDDAYLRSAQPST